MKILQIAPPWMDTPPKTYGGTEWVIANLTKGLSGLGHDVTLFATRNSKVDCKVKYVFPKALLERNIPWTAALPTLIHYHEAFKEAAGYDAVHAHLSSETDLIILPFLADLTEKGVSNVLTIHSRWPFDRYSRMDKTFLRLYGSKILAVNISQFMHETLPPFFKNGGFVHNSLDTTKMRFSPKGGSYLTWLGRIIPEKGIAEAIKIAKTAGEQLVFAGIIDKYLERSVEYFNRHIKPFIDGAQIKYLGPADLELKNKLLGGAKAFLNPISWEEPFGMVMIESMACGTPVISYNRGAAPEIVKDGETGALVRNKAEMLKSLVMVANMDRRKCRQHVEEHFSAKAAARNYLKLYRQEILLHQFKAMDKFIPANVIPFYTSSLQIDKSLVS